MENLQNSMYRYERKFFISGLSRSEIESIIHIHPNVFNEIYYERRVNNIYFDTLRFNNFQDNVIGNTDRIKFRIRWYGKIFSTINNPVLELKIKRGLVGTKKSFVLQSFKLDRGFNNSVPSKFIQDSDIDGKVKFNLQDQLPVMLNSYKRKYFQSSDKKFRLTLDSSQSFYRLNTLNNLLIDKYEDYDNFIIELKYEEKYDKEAPSITNRFPFRLTKSSKYARGIELLYSS